MARRAAGILPDGPLHLVGGALDGPLHLRRRFADGLIGLAGGLGELLIQRPHDLVHRVLHALFHLGPGGTAPLLIALPAEGVEKQQD